MIKMIIALWKNFSKISLIYEVMKDLIKVITIFISFKIGKKKKDDHVSNP